MAGPRRRLPVVQPDAGGDDEPRPPWQWAVIGAGVTLLLWLPIAALLLRVFLRPAEDGRFFLIGMAQLGGFGLSAALGGFVVGRFGKTNDASTVVGPREAAIGGGLAATFAFSLSGVHTGVFWVTVIVAMLLIAVGFLAGWLGGRLGASLRRRAG